MVEQTTLRQLADTNEFFRHLLDKMVEHPLNRRGNRWDHVDKDFWIFKDRVLRALVHVPVQRDDSGREVYPVAYVRHLMDNHDKYYNDRKKNRLQKYCSPSNNFFQWQSFPEIMTGAGKLLPATPAAEQSAESDIDPLPVARRRAHSTNSVPVSTARLQYVPSATDAVSQGDPSALRGSLDNELIGLPESALRPKEPLTAKEYEDNFV